MNKTLDVGQSFTRKREPVEARRGLGEIFDEKGRSCL
jgi:hypothetical protein